MTGLSVTKLLQARTPSTERKRLRPILLDGLTAELSGPRRMAFFEQCLRDRLSFRRFVGRSLGGATPDETTFVVFRRRLREGGGGTAA